MLFFFPFDDIHIDIIALCTVRSFPGPAAAHYELRSICGKEIWTRQRKAYLSVSIHQSCATVALPITPYLTVCHRIWCHFDFVECAPPHPPRPPLARCRHARKKKQRVTQQVAIAQRAHTYYMCVLACMSRSTARNQTCLVSYSHHTDAYQIMTDNFQYYIRWQTHDIPIHSLLYSTTLC